MSPKPSVPCAETFSLPGAAVPRFAHENAKRTEVVLQPHMVLIRTDYATLTAPWMTEFLAAEAEHTLYLPRSVLILHSGRNEQRKAAFFRTLGRHYARVHDLDEGFFLRALMRSLASPVKVELAPLEEPKPVTVELAAHDPHTVSLSLYAANRWVMGYLNSRLAPYVRSATETELLLNLSELRAKSCLERALRRHSLLHYTIEYRYDSRFMERLYAEYAGFDFPEDEGEQQRRIEMVMHYYTVLECPVGASRDALRRSYKKLVRVYHPDRVHSEGGPTVDHYTRKFQLLQEAYSALRIVS